MINNIVKHCAIYFLLFADLPKRMSSLYCALSAIKEANTSQKFPIDMLKKKSFIKVFLYYAQYAKLRNFINVKTEGVKEPNILLDYCLLVI